jgi:hypothetical protein
MFAIPLLAAAALAQKAGPVRIVFHRGANSVQLTGRLQGRQQQEYLLAGRARQTLSLELQSRPTGSLTLELGAAGAGLALREEGAHRWSAELPRTGDYLISILRAGDRPGASTYKLRLRIR